MRATDKKNVAEFLFLFFFLFLHFHFSPLDTHGKKENSFFSHFSFFKSTKKTANEKMRKEKLSLDIINYSLVTDCLDIRSLCNNDDEKERAWGKEVEVDSRMGRRVMEISLCGTRKKTTKGNEESFISAELGRAFLSFVEEKMLFHNFPSIELSVFCWLSRRQSCLREQLLRGKITFYLSFRWD